MQIFIHFPRQGRNCVNRIGDFQFLPELGLHCYKGRSLSLSEFEAIQPKLFATGVLSLPPMVKIIPDAPAELSEKLPDGVTEEDIKAMIGEIERLRSENRRLTEENDSLKQSGEFDSPPVPEVVPDPAPTPKVKGKNPKAK